METEEVGCTGEGHTDRASRTIDVGHLRRGQCVLHNRLTLVSRNRSEDDVNTVVLDELLNCGLS